MRLPKRDYKFKGDSSSESRLFWIATIIGLALLVALLYFA